MNKAVRAAQHRALLPLPPSQKMSFLAAVAVSKAAFGWHEYVPPRNTFKKLQKAIKLSVWDHKSADVNPTAILRGHAVDISSALPVIDLFVSTANVQEEFLHHNGGTIIRDSKSPFSNMLIG